MRCMECGSTRVVLVTASRSRGRCVECGVPWPEPEGGPHPSAEASEPPSDLPT